jgi:hypothetical protein
MALMILGIIKNTNMKCLSLVGLASFSIVLLLLETWRPYFFLTDDNLSAYLPVATEMSCALWSGEWPLFNRSLYGGSWNIISDPAVTVFLSPWLILFSRAATMGNYGLAIVDIVSSLNITITALSFCVLAMSLRKTFLLVIPDWFVVVLSLSYTFTPFSLLIHSSWLGFLNVQASFCIMILAITVEKGRTGILLNVCAMAWATFGGHPHGLLVGSALAGVAAAVVSWSTRSWEPLRRLLLAGLIFSIVVIAVLAPSIAEFSSSPRATGVADKVGRIPIWQLLISFIFGPLSIALIPDGIKMHGPTDSMYNLAVAFSLMNPLIVLSILKVLHQRTPLHFIQAAMAVIAILSFVLVSRPDWVSAVIRSIPLYRSLQWPFRETWVPVAAFHVWLLFGYGTLRRVEVASGISIGVFLTVWLRVGSPAPSLYPLTFDRELIFSGRAKAYWTDILAGQARPLHVVSVPPKLLATRRSGIPWPLLAGYNYPSMFGPISMSGYTYSVSPTRDPSDRPRPYFFAGAYRPEEARRVAVSHPGAWLSELVGVNPVRWTLDDTRTTRTFEWSYESETITLVRTEPSSLKAALESQSSPSARKHNDIFPLDR